MIPNPEEERQIKLYLLGDLAEEERQIFEERVFIDDNLVNQLMLVEDELVEDYVQGYLSERERDLFEKNYLKVPDRMLKVALTTHLIKHAAKAGNNAGIIPVSQVWEWIRVFFDSRWRVAALALILLTLAPLATWRLFFHKPPVDNVLVALDQAYRTGRPVEPRITGFSYAEFRFSDQRGGDTGANEEIKTDFVALERAKTLLFSADINMSDPAVLHTLGKFFLTQKEFNKAIDLLQKALIADPNNPRLHSDLGAAVLARIERDRSTQGGRKAEDVEEALKRLNQALSLDPSLLEALFNRALLYEGERLRRQAREDWQRYRQLDPNSRWGAEALEHLQEVERSLQKVSQKNEQLYRDFMQARPNGDEGMKLFSLSYSYNGNYIHQRLVDEFLEARLNGRLKEAEANLQILLQIGRLSETGTGDIFPADQARYYAQAQPEQLAKIKHAREMMAEANTLHEKGQNDRAIEKFEEARRLFEIAGNLGESLFAEARIGQCHHWRSDTIRNLQVFMRLLPVNAEKRYYWMLANTYCGLANAKNSSGRFSEAMDDSRKCGELSRRVGDQVGMIRSLIQLGIFSQGLGKHQEALRISQQGLDLSAQFSAEPEYEIGFYQNSSRSLSVLGLFEAARAFQFEAIQMAAQMKDYQRLKSRSYVYLGLIYDKWKRYDEAISSIQQGIEIGRQLGGDKTGQELVHFGLLHLANVYREAGKFNEALQAFNQIIDYYHKSSRQIYLYAGLKGRLLTFIAQKDDRAAKVELDRVIALYEQYRKSIQEESSRNSFFDQEQGIYDVAIDFAYSNLKDTKQALAYSELCRARSLLDASRRGWKTIVGQELPDLKLDAGITPAGPGEIQRQMPTTAQIVEYAVVGDKLLIWLISKTKIESSTVAIPQAELTARVNRYLESIRQPPGTDDQRWREQAAELYDLLIRPIASLLDRQKQLCIIPDKILSRLPFETLIQSRSGDRESGKLLAEEFNLLYSSSANVFLGSCEKARGRSNVQEERLLAVGNPDFYQGDFPTLSKLPTAEREAVAIANFYQAPVLLINGQARKSSVLREMGRSDVVHLALHYETNSWSPMLSRMPMAATVAGSAEKALYLYELYQYKSLQPRLVVLSGCQTTAEDYLGGEGPIGVSRPLIAAGIPLVVASLWPVDTNTTSDLMIEFHRQRKEGKHPTVEALRLAQQTFFNRKDKYRHPYYWAAFIPVGGYSEY